MRIHSAAHNGSIPGCAMYNKALLCSIWWALRKPLRKVVIERGGVVENVVIAKHVFSCSACSFWKMDLLAKNKCRLADLHLFSASLWEWGIFKSNLMKACDSFPSYLLFLFAIHYWQAFLFHWADCSGEWQSVIWHVGGHVSIESHSAVHFHWVFISSYLNILSLAEQRLPTLTALPVDCQKQASKSANIWPIPFDSSCRLLI